MVKPALSLKGRALRLLSQREHSRHELTQKLQAHEQTPGELGAMLDELQAKGFISEQRVVESLVNRRAAKLGAARIRQELQLKGLSAESIALASELLGSTERERAQEVWRKKFAGPAKTPAERAKQVRFLLARGFAAEVVRRVVVGVET